MNLFVRIKRTLANPQISIALVCLICFVAPALMIVQGAFKTEMFGASGTFSTQMFIEVVTSPNVHNVVVQTFLMGGVTVVISTVLALFFAAVFTKTSTPLRVFIPVLMFILMATPGLFFAISWGMLGNQNVGLINDVLETLFGSQARWVNSESWWGIVLVSALRLVALQFFLVLGPFMAMDRSLDEAARMSGAGPVRTFFQMEIPIMSPAITGSMILAFVLFLESFDAPQILGVPAGIFVIPTEIYAYLSNSTGPLFAQASAMSVLLMVVLLALVYIQIRVLGRRTFVTVGGKEARPLRRDVGGWRWLFTASIIGFALFTVILPMYQLIRVSLSPFLGADDGFSLANYESVLGNRRMVDAYFSTLGVAVVGAFLAMGAATAFSWAARFKAGKLAKFIEYSQWLGLAMPGLILALGVLWLFLDVPFLNGFYGTSVIMAFALFIGVIPLAGRTTGAAMAQIPKSLEEAAWVSGATKYRAAWDIVVKLMLPSLINGWLLCFVVICGVLSTPLILSAPGSNYLAVEIYSRYVEGKAPIAAAAALLLIVSFGVMGTIAFGMSKLLRRRLPPLAGAETPPDDAVDIVSRSTAGPTADGSRSGGQETPVPISQFSKTPA